MQIISGWQGELIVDSVALVPSQTHLPVRGALESTHSSIITLNELMAPLSIIPFSLAVEDRKDQTNLYT